MARTHPARCSLAIVAMLTYGCGSRSGVELGEPGDAAATDAAACATEAGGVRCWGFNGLGQLGDGTTIDRVAPIVVKGLGAIVEVAAGGNTSCARDSGGSVSCWGDGSHGQLANGKTAGFATTPMKVALDGVTSLSLGFEHACAVRDGNVWCCWGSNMYGRLGVGKSDEPAAHACMLFSLSPGYSLTPIAVEELRDASALAVGGGHTCAIREGGTVACAAG